MRRAGTRRHHHSVSLRRPLHAAQTQTHAVHVIAANVPLASRFAAQSGWSHVTDTLLMLWQQTHDCNAAKRHKELHPQRITFARGTHLQQKLRCLPRDCIRDKTLLMSVSCCMRGQGIGGAACCCGPNGTTEEYMGSSCGAPSHLQRNLKTAAALPGAFVCRLRH